MGRFEASNKARQLHDILWEQINSGQYKQRDKLLSIRELAQSYSMPVLLTRYNFMKVGF